MATARKSNGGTAITTTAAPTELAVKAAIPAPTLVTAPDVVALLQRYNKAVSPWTGFVVTSDETYVQAGLGFQEVANYIDDVESTFEKTCNILHKAWKGMTDVRGMFANPSKLVKESLATQQLSWRQKKDEERRAEERRLQREAEAAAERDREALRQQIDRENRERHEAQVAAQLALQAERMPWEDDEPAPPPPPAPTPVELPPVYVPEVRLPSTVPAVMGLSTRKRPWMASVTDFKALVIHIGKQCEAGDDRWLSVLEPDLVKLNSMAKEHTTSLKDILPGVVAVQEEGLARR